MHPAAIQWQAALLGRFGDHGACRAALGDAPLDRAWDLALRASRGTVDADALPSFGEVLAFQDAPLEVRVAASYAAVGLAQSAWLRADAEGLARIAELHAKLVIGADGTEAALWARATETALGVFVSRGKDGTDACVALAKAAAQQKIPALVIFANALHALVLLREGEFESANAVARRASRMARTEALPQFEYLATVALARVRRYLGRPHLAVRILSALARYAPAPWHPWIAWELLFAGESELALALLESGVASPVAELARGLVGALAGFEQGDLDGASSATAALEAAAGGWAFFADELGLVAAALDPRRNPGEVRSKRFQRWATGQSVELPPELHGIAVRAHGPRAHGGDSTAVVLVSPTAPARRLLWVSVATAQSLGYTMLAPTERGQARVHYGLAVLAFAGRTGLSAEELYREIYRLSFEPKADSRTLDVLVHRMRAVLPEGVQIRRERDGNLWLESSAPIVIPDPRCEQSTHDRVLRVLAKRPGLGAKDVAETLQISLRSAQETLKELAEDGACALQNEGKAHRYEVIDTTFTEPTVS